MSASYLLRFDDLCPTSNWNVWEKVEAILTEEQIEPLIAVIPDNQDAVLRVSAPDPCFWERVRFWQSMGWTIGMHGYQHRFITTNAGILGLNNYSEFAAVSRDEQRAKLQAALEVFRREYVQPIIWMAPAHSFDEVTLELLHERGIYYISDGFYLLPNIDNFGITWFPQQLWSFRWRPFGVWTICFHTNFWTSPDILRFRENVRRYRPFISSFRAVRDKYGHRKRNVADDVFALTYFGLSAKTFTIRAWSRSIRTACSRVVGKVNGRRAVLPPHI
jgi:predicted deacetylase